jgi:hypothetical protein
MKREAKVSITQDGAHVYASKCRDEIRVAFAVGERRRRWRRFAITLDPLGCKSLSREREQQAKAWVGEGDLFRRGEIA